MSSFRFIFLATPIFQNRNMFRIGFARLLQHFRRESRPVTPSNSLFSYFVPCSYLLISRKISSNFENMYILNGENINSSSQQKGQIQIIFGPMFSGKTTELIRRMKRYQIARHKCLIVKFANDVRYDAVNIATHDRQCLSAVSTTSLSDLKSMALNYSVIGIDEGQFFPDTVSFAEEMANNGKIVIVAALDGTFQRKAFGDILQLVPLAESVIKLTAICMLCFDEASFTKRIGNETQVEIIGGADKYMAVCRKCYKKESSALQPKNENLCEDAKVA